MKHALRPSSTERQHQLAPIMKEVTGCILIFPKYEANKPQNNSTLPYGLSFQPLRPISNGISRISIAQTGRRPPRAAPPSRATVPGCSKPRLRTLPLLWSSGNPAWRPRVLLNTWTSNVPQTMASIVLATVEVQLVQIR